MPKIRLIAIATMASVSAASATAQYIVFEPNKILKPCWDANLPPNQHILDLMSPYVEKSVREYEAAARDFQSLDGLFTHARQHRHWILDGVETDPRTAKDPWISKGARLKLTGFVRGNAGTATRAQWVAQDSSGSTLGTYDAYMAPRFHDLGIIELRLYSAPARPPALAPFCLVPGDIEKRQAEQTRRSVSK